MDYCSAQTEEMARTSERRSERKKHARSEGRARLEREKHSCDVFAPFTNIASIWSRRNTARRRVPPPTKTTMLVGSFRGSPNYFHGTWYCFHRSSSHESISGFHGSFHFHASFHLLGSFHETKSSFHELLLKHALQRITSRTDGVELAPHLRRGLL